MFAKSCLQKITFLPPSKSEFPSHQNIGVFADEVNQSLQATPPKLKREVGACGNAANPKSAKNNKTACEWQRQPSNGVGVKIDRSTAMPSHGASSSTASGSYLALAAARGSINLNSRYIEHQHQLPFLKFLDCCCCCCCCCARPTRATAPARSVPPPLLLLLQYGGTEMMHELSCCRALR